MEKGKIIQEEKRLANYAGDDQVISVYDMEAQLKAEPNYIVSVKSKFPQLDECLSGFEGGELTVLSGLTGHGKTLLAQTLTRNFAYQRIMSVWFTYEVMPRKFIESFGNTIPAFYLPQKLKTCALDWLEDRIVEAKLKYDCRVVFIDHLHFLVDMRSKNNMSLEIGHVMRFLKQMAVNHNLIFFLIAHTTKVNPDSELDLDALRDSSFIAQEADNVLMVWRKLNSDREAILKVCKNRKNGTYRKIPIIRGEDGLLGEMHHD